MVQNHLRGYDGIFFNSKFLSVSRHEFAMRDSYVTILAMFDDNEEARPQGLDAADAVLVRPSLRLLADDRRRVETERMADELRRALAPWSMLGDEPSAGATAVPSDSR